MCSLVTFGQEVPQKGLCYIKIKNGAENTTYYFDHIKDLEEHVEKIVTEIHLPEKKKKKDPNPEPEIEISITYNHYTLSETVSVNHELIKKALLKLKNLLNIPFQE